MQSIRVTCEGAGRLSLLEMRPLQGDLKKLSKGSYKKLRAEILENGFSFPIAVWEDRSTNDFYILDGHQRHETLRRMKEEGFKIPELPVVYVQAEDLNRAKMKLLAAASQFGEVSGPDLEKFIRGIDGEISELVGRLSFSNADLSDLIPKVEDERDLSQATQNVDTPEPDETEDDVEEDQEESERVEAAQETKPEPRPSSSLRTLVLYMDATEARIFENQVSFLQQKLKLESATATIKEVINAKFESYAKED